MQDDFPIMAIEWQPWSMKNVFRYLMAAERMECIHDFREILFECIRVATWKSQVVSQQTPRNCIN